MTRFREPASARTLRALQPAQADYYKQNLRRFRKCHEVNIAVWFGLFQTQSAMADQFQDREEDSDQPGLEVRRRERVAEAQPATGHRDAFFHLSLVNVLRSIVHRD